MSELVENFTRYIEKTAPILCYQKINGFGVIPLTILRTPDNRYKVDMSVFGQLLELIIETPEEIKIILRDVTPESREANKAHEYLFPEIFN